MAKKDELGSVQRVMEALLKYRISYSDVAAAVGILADMLIRWLKKPGDFTLDRERLIIDGIEKLVKYGR